MSIAETHKYDDIINMPHHISHTRPRMSNYDRAAQFSPFAALTGYDAAVKETERLTDQKLELTDDEKIDLNEKLQIIIENIDNTPNVTLTYFEPDKRKAGGKYITKSGKVKEIDSYIGAVVFEDRTKVDINAIKDISSQLFVNYYFE